MKKYSLTLLKYGFTIILILAGYTTMHSKWMIVFSFLELLFIMLLSNSLKQVSKHFQILNNVLMLLFNAQCLVALFGSSYISYVMLENLDSIEALKGRIVAYSLGVISVLILSFLPVRTISYTKKWLHVLAPLCLVVELAGITALDAKQSYTPAYGYLELFIHAKEQYEMKQTMQAFVEELDMESVQDTMEELFTVEEEDDSSAASQIIGEDSSQDAIQSQEKDPVENHEEPVEEAEVDENEMYALPSQGFDLLGSDKNVILIFTEGLSKHVIQDERNIMPNVAQFANESIEFTNYFNHTFATYRGLQGQLFSGHQVELYDQNHLPSLMSVLKEAGYYTAMINVEAENDTFTNYLNNLGFDEVYSDLADGFNILDEGAYDSLYAKALELMQQQKFLLTIYTFQTHASFDAEEFVFGDGSNSELNKFYNCDYHFGRFFEAFKQSPLAENTVIIFTADHATYGDELFVKAFPDYGQRICSSCDEIPLYVYYQGMHEIMDAQGRNSLDLAPTILDMLGLQKPVTFLGSSLFYPKVKEHAMDTYFWCPGTVYFTGNSKLEDPLNRREAVIQNVTEYSILSQQ